MFLDRFVKPLHIGVPWTEEEANLPCEQGPLRTLNHLPRCRCHPDDPLRTLNQLARYRCHPDGPLRTLNRLARCRCHPDRFHSKKSLYVYA